MKKLQIVVRFNNKDFGAVSSAPAFNDAIIECMAEIQQLVFNTVGVMPDRTTLIKHIRRIGEL